jgi:hypothetical protein
MPAVGRILLVILGIVWVVPMIQDAFTPAPPAPPPAPTVVVVESGDGGAWVLLGLGLGVLGMAAVTGTAALIVWLVRRNLRRQRAELAALRARRQTLGAIILDGVDPDVLADPPGTVRGRQVYPRDAP